jgi:4-hydroxy-tetrahydrodipicolinate reductase
MSTISLAIAGAAGRMGRRLIALASEEPHFFTIAAATDAPNSPFLGKDAGVLAGAAPLGIAVTATLAGSPDVLIDFSAAPATRLLIDQCVQRKIAMIIGTTGLTAADQETINQAAHAIPILQATNTSLGVNVLLAITAQVARQLGDDYDIEIVEAHHNQKKDAPSGTALSLAESICKSTGRSMDSDLVYGRGGKVGGARDQDETRKKGTIGMHAVRMGDVVGEHAIYYATPGERIEIRHVATSRDTFARGALRAAAFLARQKPGRYTMNDVLGL